MCPVDHSAFNPGHGFTDIICGPTFTVHWCWEAWNLLINALWLSLVSTDSGWDKSSPYTLHMHSKFSSAWTNVESRHCNQHHGQIRVFALPSWLNNLELRNFSRHYARQNLAWSQHTTLALMDCINLLTVSNMNFPALKWHATHAPVHLYEARQPSRVG